jgi:hypothetical protein
MARNLNQLVHDLPPTHPDVEEAMGVVHVGEKMGVAHVDGDDGDDALAKCSS